MHISSDPVLVSFFCTFGVNVTPATEFPVLEFSVDASGVEWLYIKFMSDNGVEDNEHGSKFRTWAQENSVQVRDTATPTTRSMFVRSSDIREHFPELYRILKEATE